MSTGVLGRSRTPCSDPSRQSARDSSYVPERRRNFSVPYLVVRIPLVAGSRRDAHGHAGTRIRRGRSRLGPPRNVSFTRAELKSFTGATLPDLIAEGVRLLFVGINPGLCSVAVQGHFAPLGNRFYRALLRAGVTDHLIDASAGLAPADRDYLLRRGVGITSLVERATASADELGPTELADGARALGAKIARFRPRAVAILGVTAYRTAFAAPRAVLGRQPEDLHGSQLWVVPNPSGRNAHAPLDTLAAAYRAVAQAAGLRTVE